MRVVVRIVSQKKKLVVHHPTERSKIKDTVGNKDTTKCFQYVWFCTKGNDMQTKIRKSRTSLHRMTR